MTPEEDLIKLLRTLAPPNDPTFKEMEKEIRENAGEFRQAIKEVQEEIGLQVSPLGETLEKSKQVTKTLKTLFGGSTPTEIDIRKALPTRKPKPGSREWKQMMGF